jgi:hypothetical protein
MTRSTQTSPLALALGDEAEIRAPPEPLKRRAAASAYLREQWGIERAPGTLAKLAVVGGGPRFRKVGRIPLYAAEDLDGWARALLGEPVASTSELKGKGPRDGQSGATTQIGRADR